MILDNAVQALNDAGILAKRACPGGKTIMPSGPVAAVSLQQAALRGQTMTVQAVILSPMESGQALCEETAMAAGEVLTALGGNCEVGACGFDGRAGLFQETVTAKFLTAIPKVKLENTLLQYVEAFTCWRTVDEDLEITDLDDAPWQFRLEEFFPLDALEEEEPEEPFTLTHISESGTETYYECKWTYQRRAWGATGTRQIRLGSAQRMENG